jgi:hypothetical protein
MGACCFGGMPTCTHRPQQPTSRSDAQEKQRQGCIWGYVRKRDVRFYYYNTHANTCNCDTPCIYVSLSTRGAPPCRTTHARDAAGAAPKLGVTHGSPLCSYLYRSRRLPAAPRNANVRRAYPRPRTCRSGVPDGGNSADHGPWCQPPGQRRTSVRDSGDGSRMRRDANHPDQSRTK